ncbi:Endoplasmic reticulum aminopeptidase 1 [Thelohanellus kitauei]|uniref:Endoplasmic reticulum aminopeptidase 1 n=1 Tax=Thelohanellus kitauei TaxID=669202 RepID=A0A0C2IAP5_THEKT|nr:Endoplasmic reticulum aminopeptidase 1 [Thelohanellus kitauei]
MFGNIILMCWTLDISSTFFSCVKPKAVFLRSKDRWFGNLVTMKWWNDLWLNEGFANLIETYGANYLYPKFDFLNQHILNGWSQAIEYDSIKNSHCLSQPIELDPTIDELFDPISYNKVAIVVNTGRVHLEDDRIRDGYQEFHQRT